MERQGAAIHQHRETTEPALLDEARLFDRVRQRDRSAFEALYRNYHPLLVRFLTGLIHRPQLVQEVLNDTMLVVWTRPESFNGDSKLSTWIFGIAYHKAMKALRQQPDPVEDARAELRVSPDAGPDQHIGQQRLQALLADAIGELSPDHRTVVDLTYFHGIGYREIAEIMECPVDTVKTRMFHARRQLRRLLAGELADWL